MPLLYFWGWERKGWRLTCFGTKGHLTSGEITLSQKPIEGFDDGLVNGLKMSGQMVVALGFVCTEYCRITRREQ